MYYTKDLLELRGKSSNVGLIHGQHYRVEAIERHNHIVKVNGEWHMIRNFKLVYRRPRGYLSTV